MSEARAGPPPRLPGRRPGRHAIRAPRCSTTSGGTRRPSSRSGRSPPTGSPSCPRAGCARPSTCGSTAPSSSTTSPWSSARCSRTRWSASPAATSTSSPASPARRSSTSRTGSGALITSAEIIGTRGITPVRALIDEAAPWSRASGSPCAWSCSPGTGALHAAAFGDPQAAWAAAADVSAETHVTYLDAPVRRVLSLVPRSTTTCGPGAKGFYKVEPVVADGGEVVLYAPHITRGRVDAPARSARSATTAGTTSSGSGTASGRSRGATWPTPPTCAAPGPTTRSTASALGSPSPWRPGSREEEVRAVNLDYLDPAEVDLDAWAADPDTLVVPQAGEVLYRLR